MSKETVKLIGASAVGAILGFAGTLIVALSALRNGDKTAKKTDENHDPVANEPIDNVDYTVVK